MRKLRPIEANDLAQGCATQSAEDIKPRQICSFCVSCFISPKYKFPWPQRMYLSQQSMYLSHETVRVGRWKDALASKGWHFSGCCSQMNGLLSQVLDLSNNEHVFLSTGDIHYPVTIHLSLYELVLSPLHGRNVMYGISNSQGWCRPLFQVVIDRGSNGPAVQVWYFKTQFHQT